MFGVSGLGACLYLMGFIEPGNRSGTLMCAPGSLVTPAVQMKRNDIRENCLIVAQITGSGKRVRPVSALTFLSGRFNVKGRVYGAFLVKYLLPMET